MGKITDENRRRLEAAETVDDIELSGMLDNVFCEELDKLIIEKGFTTQQIVKNSCLSKSYINKLRNPQEKKALPRRNTVIDIALALDANLEETNRLLKYARYQELYTRDPADALIIWGLLKKKSGKEIRELLFEMGFLDSLFTEREKPL